VRFGAYKKVNEMQSRLAEWIARREKILEGVREILINNLNVRREADEIDPDSALFGSGLGLDSVDAVELVVSLENRFGLRVPSRPGERAALRTVNSLVDLVIALEDQRDESG
jgi:acyl carrier protein